MLKENNSHSGLECNSDPDLVAAECAERENVDIMIEQDF